MVLGVIVAAEADGVANMAGPAARARVRKSITRVLCMPNKLTAKNFVCNVLGVLGTIGSESGPMVVSRLPVWFVDMRPEGMMVGEGGRRGAASWGG